MERDILHRHLHPRACLLAEGNDSIKLSDYWTTNDVDDLFLFQNDNLLINNINESAIMYRDGWRYVLGRIRSEAPNVKKNICRMNIQISSGRDST